MDAAYWERVGSRYEASILDSAQLDRSGAIRARLDEFADPSAVAADFGCGVGHYLPLLASRFRAVHGVDFAESLLAQARARCRGLANVRIHRADLVRARARLPFARVRAGVCANVLISADARLRKGILASVARQVVRGGRVLFLLPSLESALFANQRLVEWNRRLGWSEEEALATGIPPTARGAKNLLRGLIPIEGVATRHYLREEAVVMLAGAGFTVVASDRAEYGWETEFEDPPAWMGSPGPWDWLLVARRR